MSLVTCHSSLDPSSGRTIVAVSSPPGRSPRGLLRISGPDAFSILNQLLLNNAHAPRAWVPRTLTPALLCDPAIPVLVARFPGPHSYNADDIAELQLPGHPALLDRVIHAALDAGARLAEPGEFTYRAYLAGRLDLTEAEGVSATIAAVSDSQLAAASHLLKGELGRFADQLVDLLGTLLALVEAGIDFVDQEDVVPIAPSDLAMGLVDAQSQLADLLSRSRSWGTIDAPPRVVLVGPPSAGKSTLFNALLGKPRAVTDAAPGTTRDVLVEPMQLPDAAGEILLVDVAGLDDARSLLDTQIQQKANDTIATADLILLLSPPLKPRAEAGSAAKAPDTPTPNLPSHIPTLYLQTRSDLPSFNKDPQADLHVSGTTGHNLDALRSAIADRLGDRATSLAADMLALQPRHESALREAEDHLRASLTSFDPTAHSLDDIELTAAALRAALDALASLGGQLTPDDIIGRVFATFCVGK